jgi:hypothetical protein
MIYDETIEKYLYKLDEDFTYKRIIQILYGNITTKTNVLEVINGELKGLSFEFDWWSTDTTSNNGNMEWKNNYKILTKPENKVKKEELEEKISLLVLSYILTLKK